MSDTDKPWWYSGPPDENSGLPPGDGGESAPEDDTPAVDWMGMLSGAARMVDWARDAVLDPHTGHSDPTEHPDCLICRTLVIVGDQVGMSATGDAPPAEPAHAPAARTAEPIRWIPISDRP